MTRRAPCANAAAASARRDRDKQSQRTKKWPRKSGPLVESRISNRSLEAKARIARTLDSQALEAETGQVAVADRDLRRSPSAGGRWWPSGGRTGRLEGARAMEAVLDIVVPFSGGRSGSASSSGDNLCIPDASHNRLVCMAAFIRVHCSINTLFGIPNNEKGRRNRRPFAGFGLDEAAYSAACLRGGSSAPESWISATW